MENYRLKALTKLVGANFLAVFKLIIYTIQERFSLTVLSEQELEDARVNSFRDIAVNTPNFFTTIGDRFFDVRVSEVLVTVIL